MGLKPRDGSGPRPAHGRRPRPGQQEKTGSIALASGKTGLGARFEAVRLIAAVLEHGHSLDEALVPPAGSRTAQLEPRDRAFARLIATTVLRHKGELDAVLKAYLAKPLPARAGPLLPILLAASAQLLFLETPPHAAISLAVDQVRTDRASARFDKLVNAVLRRVATEGAGRLAALEATALNIPAWLLARWTASYGPERARAIARASLMQAPLDITAKADAPGWAERLGAALLPTGSLRLEDHHGRIEDLPGFTEGAWWVQDAAAALPARLVDAKPGCRIADSCAAPGGKTAQLAAAGAQVTAVDSAGRRLERLTANLTRLGLAAETIAADVRGWQSEPFDAVLLDAPCSATGTIRRHPDILHLKREADVATLAALQADLIDASARLVRPGGRLVFCTCSLEPEEGESQWQAFLARQPQFTGEPIRAGEIGGQGQWLTASGEVRTLPGEPPRDAAGAPLPGGIDGFFIGRAIRSG